MQDIAERLFRLAQNHKAAGVQQPPRFGRLHPVRGAQQQGRLELVVEAGDLLADHRFGEDQALGCLSERAGVGDRSEIDEPVEVVASMADSVNRRPLAYSLSDSTGFID